MVRSELFISLYYVFLGIPMLNLTHAKYIIVYNILKFFYYVLQERQERKTSTASCTASTRKWSWRRSISTASTSPSSARRSWPEASDCPRDRWRSGSRTGAPRSASTSVSAKRPSPWQHRVPRTWDRIIKTWYPVITCLYRYTSKRSQPPQICHNTPWHTCTSRYTTRSRTEHYVTSPGNRCERRGRRMMGARPNNERLGTVCVALCVRVVEILPPYLIIVICRAHRHARHHSTCACHPRKSQKRENASVVQRQTAVTAYSTSKQFLLFVFAL